MTVDPGLRLDAGSRFDTCLAVLFCADEEVHDLAQSWLTVAGIRVTSASAAQDAAKQILDEEVDLLVLDTLPIYLPGLPSLGKLKAERRQLRVILIPSLDGKPEIGVARLSGVDAILARPLSKAKLLSVVDALRAGP
jgi:DNA-binding response OmpR family regulator